MSNFINGDVSLSQTLTDSDHLYPDLFNELRESMVVSAVVGLTENCEYYCDGTADDVQIQAAIDAVNSAGGGIVLIKAGTYSISSTIYIKSNVYLVGEGMTQTKLVCIAAFNATGIDITASTTADNIGLMNFQFDHNGANFTSGDTHAIRLVEGTTGFVVDRVQVLNACHHGLQLGGVINGVVSRCDVRDSGAGAAVTAGIDGVGILIGADNGTPNWVRVVNNYVEGGTYHGIQAYYGTTHVSIIGNQCVDNGQDVNNSNPAHGIKVNCNYCVVQGNIVKNPNSHAIVYNGTNIVISGNVIDGGEDGIRSILEADSSYTSITNNIINNPSNDGIIANGGNYIVCNNNTVVSQGSDLAGIVLSSNFGTCIGNLVQGGSSIGIRVYADNNIVTGNSVSACTTGVRTEAGADKTIITSNQLGANTTALTDAGTNTTSANNITT